MKKSVVFNTKELFPGSKIICRFTFKTLNTRDNCALLARAYHQLAQISADTRDESALLANVHPLKSANTALTRGYFSYFYNQDCFECLSPHNISV